MLRDRIIGLRMVPASKLVPHPLNWRGHTGRQRAALKQTFHQVGFVGYVRAYQDGDQYVVIDGHLRRDMLADQEVPVLLLDLTPAEAHLLLSAADPLALMAEKDSKLLESLLSDVQDSGLVIDDSLLTSMYTAGVLVGRIGNRFYVLDVFREQFSSGKRDAKIALICALDTQAYGHKVMTRFEQEPGSGGQQSAEISLDQLAGYRVSKEPAVGKKTLRAEPLAIAAENGCLYVKEAPWNKDFIAEMSVFDKGKHDDQVDAAAGAYYLARSRQPISVTLLASACTLPCQPRPTTADGVYSVACGALYQDPSGAVAYVTIGVDRVRGRLVLLDARTFRPDAVDAAEQIAEFARQSTTAGVAFVAGAVPVTLLGELKKRGVKLYQTDMSPAGKRKLADFAVASFRNGRIHLYRDDALLVQVSRLPIRSVNDSYFTLDALETPLPLGMAFAVSLRWACGTLMAAAA